MEGQNSLATFWTFGHFGHFGLVIVIPSLQKEGIANLVGVGQKTAKSDSGFRAFRAKILDFSPVYLISCCTIVHCVLFFLFYLLLCLFYFFFSSVFACSFVASLCSVVFFLGNHFSLFDFYLCWHVNFSFS